MTHRKVEISYRLIVAPENVSGRARVIAGDNDKHSVVLDRNVTSTLRIKRGSLPHLSQTKKKTVPPTVTTVPPTITIALPTVKTNCVSKYHIQVAKTSFVKALDFAAEV